MAPVIPQGAPAAQFQAPNIPGLYRPNQILPQSIDQLFNAYQQQQAQDQALKLGQAQLAAAQQNNAASLAQFQLQNGGLTPQQVSQYLPQAMAMPNGPGMVPSQPTPLMPQQQSPLQQIQQGPIVPQGPQMQPAQEDPGLATVRHILAMHQQSLQLGAAQQVAGLQKTQAEAEKAGAEAGLTQAQVALLGGNDAIVGNIVNQIKGGKMTLDDLSSLGRGDVANAIKVGVSSQLAAQGVNTNALKNQQTSNKAGAELSGGGSSQEMARSANSAYKQFDLLQQASDNFSRTNNQLLNTPLLKIDATKYPEAQVFKTALSTARIEYARAASGSKSPSDTFMQEARAALPDGITPAQIKPTLDQLRNSLSEQTRGQLTPANIENAPPLIKQPASGQTVSIRLPDGRTGNIPAANLNAALARGAVRL